MKWTDRLRHIRLLFILVAVLIAAGFLLVSHLLVRDLSKEESARMGRSDACLEWGRRAY